MKRDLRLYIGLALLLVFLGLPARIIEDQLPIWYTRYFGDFLWAMMVYLGFATVFRLKVRVAFWIAITTCFLIEVTQLFHPEWLDYLRSFKLIGLVLGFHFLWSDLVAYTFGILLAAWIDSRLLTRRDRD